LGNGGKGRFPLKFPLNLDWHSEQACTEIKSLHHRKERIGFQHEFIVLNLLDGSICRLERMGDPDARLDALSAQGSVAHDVAQSFPPDMLSDACLDTSDVVAEIIFPCQLDIIDVLRVCRAIHEGEKTCNYTLQSFNCYFFALAIQSVLARLVADWGAKFTAETWSSAVHSALCALTNAYDTASFVQHGRPFLLRLYSLLQPDFRWPTESLTNQLMAELGDNDRFVQIENAMNSVLWHSTLGFAIDYTLESHTRDVMVRALQGHPDDPTQELCQLKISNLQLASSKDRCRILLGILVSQAASRHELDSQNPKCSRLQQYIQLFQNFQLFLYESTSGPVNLDYRGTKKPQSAFVKIDRSTGYFLSSTQQVLTWLTYAKAFALWALHVALCLLWIAPMGFIEHRRCKVVEDELAPTLAVLEASGHDGMADITPITQKLHSLSTTLEPVIWDEWPWTHMHEPIKQHVLNAISNTETALLQVRLQVSCNPPCFQRT
jgi:hypothetical protein